MTTRDLVSKFNRFNSDNRSENRITFFINNRSIRRDYAPNHEVKDFTVSTYSDGSIAVYIVC